VSTIGRIGVTDARYQGSASVLDVSCRAYVLHALLGYQMKAAIEGGAAIAIAKMMRLVLDLRPKKSATTDFCCRCRGQGGEGETIRRTLLRDLADYREAPGPDGGQQE
jgi:hypothetical protein